MSGTTFAPGEERYNFIIFISKNGFKIFLIQNQKITKANFEMERLSV